MAGRSRIEFLNSSFGRTFPIARWQLEQHPEVLALIDRLARALTSDLPAPQAT